MKFLHSVHVQANSTDFHLQVWTMPNRCTDSWNDLGFSLCAMLSVCHIVTISDERKKSEIRVSANLVYHCWTSEIKFNKNLSLSIIRLANYSVTTSLIYEFLLWEMLQGFSDIASVTLSGGFSVETLTGVTLPWKTELNRSISVMEDRISR